MATNQSITDYMKGRIVGSTIIDAGVDSNGDLFVQIDDGKRLYLDESERDMMNL